MVKQSEIARMRRYIHIVDPPIPPTRAATWAEIQKDGMIPSYNLIRLAMRAEERAKAREGRKEKARAFWAKCLAFKPWAIWGG